MSPGESERKALLQKLPSVDALMLHPRVAKLLERYPRPAVLDAARGAVASLRGAILDATCNANAAAEDGFADRIASLCEEVRDGLERGPSLRRVINATGVVLHTNLGRAPLSQAAIDHVAEIAGGYCNLELDLDSGERSRRDVHAEAAVLRVLRQLSGVQTSSDYGVVVVNNCAAATFLALNSLAEGREVIVSRGELIEIGGGFRIPEILAKSGARMREVGTTNRTRIADYEKAFTSETAIVLRVHQSNFSMEGFTERPALRDLADLCRQHRVPLFDDQGTGLLVGLESFGVPGQETLTSTFQHGSDLIAASGDKLLGGPQCGLLVGRKHLIEKVRENPLLRAFRVDKLTYAALGATLQQYLVEGCADLPVFRMLNRSAAELEARGAALAAKLNSDQLFASVTPVRSVIGGGTTPAATMPSYALALRGPTMSAANLHRALRTGTPAVLGRIHEESVLLDLRTVEPCEDQLLLRRLLTLPWQFSQPVSEPSERRADA